MKEPLRKLGAAATDSDVQPLPPGVDPSQVDTWLVRVRDSFTTASTTFLPGQDYWVAPDIYNSKLDDGTTFISHCATARVQLKA